VADIARATIIGRMTGGSLKDPNGNVYTAAQIDTLANQLTNFMSSLFSAQDNTHGAGFLGAKGATGGVVNLSKQLFHFGINDVLQGDFIVCGTPGNPAALEASLCGGQSPGTIVSTTNPVTPFTPVIFTEFNAWHQDPNPRRAAIERGQALFNAQRLTISGVGGINRVSDPGDGLCVGAGCPVQNGTLTLPSGSTANGVASFTGSCGVCHDTPNVGNHSTRLPINIGIADKAPAGLGREAVGDLPLFIMTRNSDGAVAQTTDPGRAVISGQFSHIGQFKGPILHGMAARAPFFHNGMAATLEQVVDFYNERFNGHFTAQEKADLVAFLGAL
jgi:hypothetical protein